MRGIQLSHAWRRPLVLGVLILTLVSAGTLTWLAADLTEPRANDRQVTRVVTSLMRNQHLTKQPFDDVISRRGLTAFLESLDPMKVYFYQQDVDEFRERENELDDDIKRGDISFAYTIFARFLKRVQERTTIVDEILAGSLDFTIDEPMIIDRDEARYPRNAEEAKNRWRKRIKYDLLVLRDKGDDNVAEGAKERIGRRYRNFAKRMQQTDEDELLEMYLTAVISTFDPHTTYMSPSSLTNFRILMRLNLEGIGAALRVDDGYTVVTKVIPGGAADKHGKLKPEDKIVSVGQEVDGEMVDVVDMKLNHVVKMIRGKAGTVVRLGVLPATGGEVKIYNITRARVELKDSEAQAAIFEEGQKANGAPYRVGVIDLPSFYMDMEAASRRVENYKSTTRDVRRILEKFNEKGVDAVVLDLRHNGGGSLTEAINLTGLFIDEGPVVQVKDPDGRVQNYDDTDEGMSWDGPLVVVTDKFSASASEIFAGAIQDYGRGIVVGDDATHGKGTVQSLLDLGGQLFRIPDPPNLGALKITMQQFYRPNGESTQKRGVLADVVLPSLTSHMDVAEGDLPFALEFDQIPAARYSSYQMVNPEILTRLRAASEERVSESKDFQELRDKIRKYVKQKEEKVISLNEEKFAARRAELNIEKEEEKQFDEQDDGTDDEIIKRDYYMDEVLDLTVDYLNFLNNKVARAR